jgi:hypothetical protein
MSEQNDTDIFSTFDVIPRWVQVDDVLPIQKIDATFSIVNPAIRKIELIHRPGCRLMSVLEVTEQVPIDDIVKIYVPNISTEIESKLYKVRCATIEETVAYLRLFPEDFPTHLKIIPLGEYISKGESLHAVRIYALDSKYVMSLVKIDESISQFLFCAVFEEVGEVV